MGSKTCLHHTHENIHALILRVMENDHSLREAKIAERKKASSVRRTGHAAQEAGPGPPPAGLWPELHIGTALELSAVSARGLPKHQTLLNALLFTFWKNVRLQPCMPGQCGTSWLEALCRFQQIGGKLFPDELQDSDSQVHHTFKNMLGSFILRPVSCCTFKCLPRSTSFSNHVGLGTLP